MPLGNSFISNKYFLINHLTFILNDTQSDLETQTKYIFHEKVQVGKDQEKTQSEKDSHPKNPGGKKPN